MRAGGIGTYVAESLNHDTTALDEHVEIAQALAADNQHAAAGRFNASVRAANVRGLPVTTLVTVWPMCME